MKPIVLVKDQDGKVVVTVDEIKKMVEDAYDDGYMDGSSNRPTIVTTPAYPSWWHDHFTITCETPSVTL